MGNASFQVNSAETGCSLLAERTLSLSNSPVSRLSSSLDYCEGNYTALVGSGEREKKIIQGV